MAEEKAASKAAEPKRYVATENCIYGTRYLGRGDVVVLTEKPDHRCLVELKENSPAIKGAQLIDPIQEMIEKKRIAAAVQSFKG